MLKAVAKTATNKIAFMNFMYVSRLLSPQAAVPVWDYTDQRFSGLFWMYCHADSARRVLLISLVRTIIFTPQ